MTYIPQPPPPMDFVQNGAGGSPGFPKNGTFPKFSADTNGGATPGLTGKGTNQLGSPGISGGPDFPASVPVTDNVYTAPPNPGSTITDEISGAQVVLASWDPKVGKGIGAVTLAALKNAPLTLITGASNTVVAAVLRWRLLLGL